ncbi:F-box/WD repeat-containing protein 7-like isoform X2 [Ornithodoros turicata]
MSSEASVKQGSTLVDINTSTIEELASVDAIDRATAEAIVAARNSQGSFGGVSDLLTVPGVDHEALAQLRPHLVCATTPHDEDRAEGRRCRSDPSSSHEESALLPTSPIQGLLDAAAAEDEDSDDEEAEDMDSDGDFDEDSAHEECGDEVTAVDMLGHIKHKSEGEPDHPLPPTKKARCHQDDGDISMDSTSTEPPISPHSMCHTPRRRHSSKPLPPAQLGAWIETFQTWNNVERRYAIDRLIEACEPEQVRHMMNVIEPQFQRDFISLLPKELALYVLSFLEARDLLRAAQTCHYWRILAEDNLLWREKCREAGIEDVKEVLGRRVASPPVRNGSCVLEGQVASAPIPWKAAFMRHHYIEMNWRCKPIREPKVLKGHDDHVITCLQFSGQRIVSGSDDNTLKVWSASTGRCLRTLVGHTGGVWSSQMSGSLVVSGSTDRTLKVWNADTGHCVHTLYGHTSTVRCMHLHANRVVSGSRDATLRVWDLDSGTCLHVLVGHVAAVRCVQYNGRLVVSGAYDYMVKVWDPEREECLHTLQGHTNRVYSLQFDGVHVVSGSLDTSIRVWDVETGACKHQLMGHQSLTSGMELRNNILVSGNADSTVKVWDIVTGQCLQTLAGPNKHQSAVTCLQFNSKFVVTSSDDGTVKLWDLRTGEFLRNLVALESGGSGGVVWRIRASPTKLVCAVGSRNGTEETKLLVLDFDEPKSSEGKDRT